MDGTEAVLIAPTSGEGTGITKHHSRRVIPGDVADVRANLKFALEKLDYFVEQEQPLLIASRKTQLSNYGGKLIAGNILPYVKRLQIPLVPSTDNSTVATFDYAIMNSAVTKGDRKTVESEINALVALATSLRLQMICPACGTSATNDSRFCRVCGIASANAEPAELEVLRLTANARAAHQTIVGGVIFMLCWILFILPLWLLSHQSAAAAAIILGGGALFGCLWIFNGIHCLHRTLNTPDEAQETLPASLSGLPSRGNADSLPPPSARASITEGTTELLNPLHKEKTAISSGSKDTKEIY